MEAVYRTFREQQRKDSLGPYRFSRVTDRQGDTLLNDGWGSPVNPVGLIVSSFRPTTLRCSASWYHRTCSLSPRFVRWLRFFVS